MTDTRASSSATQSIGPAVTEDGRPQRPRLHRALRPGVALAEPPHRGLGGEACDEGGGSALHGPSGVDPEAEHGSPSALRRVEVLLDLLAEDGLEHGRLAGEVVAPGPVRRPEQAKPDGSRDGHSPHALAPPPSAVRFYAPAHRRTVSHVRVVTSVPRVASISFMNTGPCGLRT